MRLRFAPSPTGSLHVGGARTALFNYLMAKKAGGEFVLRIEDTDGARSKQEHVEVILQGLEWLGVKHDGEVVYQGGRAELHRQAVKDLLHVGAAYEDQGAVRLHATHLDVEWKDFVHGKVTVKKENLQDWVLLRSDGTPTYNLAVVVDDWHMGITHVLRGDDHISNTPKQIALYHALGAPMPVFGHVPMIHGMDGKKLSKRHGATAVGDYQHKGILASAMRNYLCLLGWNPGTDRELFYSLEELVEVFDASKLRVSASRFDPVKLEWMNGKHRKYQSGGGTGG